MNHIRQKQISALVTCIVLIVALTLSHSSALARPPIEKSEEKTEVKETPEIRVSEKDLVRITRDKKFRAALDVVATQREAVDTKNAKQRTFEPGIRETTFAVTVKGARTPAEYSKLVYLEEKGKDPVVFFDAPGAKKEKDPKVTPIPCPDGPWTIVNEHEHCVRVWLCRFAKGSWLRLESRKVRCNTQTQLRLVRSLGCDCKFF